jgi:hypothetical protein
MQSNASISHHASALARHAALKALSDHFRQEGDRDPEGSAVRAFAALKPVVVMRLRKKPGRPSKAIDRRTVPYLFGSMLKEVSPKDKTAKKTAAVAEKIVARKQSAVGTSYGARAIGNIFRNQEKSLKKAFADAGMSWPTKLKRLTRKRVVTDRASRSQS